jgi:large subunit ribosomal protein L15
MAKRKTHDRLKRSNVVGERKKTASREANPSNLIPVPKGASSPRKRIGRGPGSGMGKTSTRGQKGQRARAATMRPGFEGGQMRLVLRIPKRGFTNIFKQTYQPVNIFVIDKLGLKGEVTPEILEKNGLIQDASAKVKVLGNGELKSAVTIIADAISKSAEEKVTKAGGKFVARQPKAKTAEVR